MNYRHWNGWGDPEVPAPRVSWWVSKDYPTLPPPFPILRRSNSISKSPGPSSPKEPLLFSRDISRSESLRCSSSYSQQIFRPCDLIHGEVLGKGFFGQAIKVSTGGSCSAPLPPKMFDKHPSLTFFREILPLGLTLHPAGHQASFLAAGDGVRLGLG